MIFNIKTLTTSIFLLTNFLILAQDCEEKIDQFTGKKTTIYQMSKFGVTKMKLEQIESDSISMTYRIVIDKIESTAIPKGSSLLLKLDNDKIIELKSIKNSEPRSGTVSTGSYGTSYSEAFLMFNITESQLKLLKNYKVEFIREPNFKGGYVDLSRKKTKKLSKHLSKGAECMLN